MKTALYFLAIIVIAYVALAAFIFWYQPRLVFLPDIAGRELVATPADINLAYEDLRLETSDGVRIHAWYVPSGQARRTIIFFHGNAGNISHRLETLRLLNLLDLNVLMVEYRGYGQSEGTPSEKGTVRDAQAAWQYLIENLGRSADDIIIFGRSLGGAVAAQLARHHRPAGLVLESTFTSVPDIGAEIYPWLPVRWLSRIRYDTLHVVQTTDVPVLIVHSPGDDVIPYRHGEKLFAEANEPKQFMRIGGGHNGGYLLDLESYLAGWRRFLEQVR